MRIENLISFRFIKEIRKNKDISSASLIVISVIAISMIFFIISSSIMNGYIYGLMKIAFEVKSFHVSLTGFNSLSDTNYLLDMIKEDKLVKYAGIYRESNVLLSAKGKTTGLVYFRSAPEDIFIKDKEFDRLIKITEGNKSLLKNEIMISKKTSEKINIKSGEFLYLTTLIPEEKDQVIIKRLKVAGIFTTGFIELDEQLAYVGNATGEDIFKNFLIYKIFVKLNDYKKSALFENNVSALGAQQVHTWQELNEYEFKALNFEKNIIVFIIILVVFVAALNILTTINISIIEKSKNIGILKAIGYSKKNIFLIFTFYGLYLGFIGVLTGITAGLLLMNYLNEIINITTYIYNSINNLIYHAVSVFIKISEPDIIEIFSKDFYLDRIYAEISFAEIFFISFITLLFSLISSLIPAVRAKNIQPIEVIKNG